MFSHKTGSSSISKTNYIVLKLPLIGALSEIDPTQYGQVPSDMFLDRFVSPC